MYQRKQTKSVQSPGNMYITTHASNYSSQPTVLRFVVPTFSDTCWHIPHPTHPHSLDSTYDHVPGITYPNSMLYNYIQYTPSLHFNYYTSIFLILHIYMPQTTQPHSVHNTSTFHALHIHIPCNTHPHLVPTHPHSTLHIHVPCTTHPHSM